MIKNAIVVMFDSLQFNYLGCYGNDWIKTPNMDRLAREGVLFENCYIEGLPTVPCRRAMHTGRFTLPYAGWQALSMEDTTIADLCWGRPIDTALIFDCPMYRLPKFGYSRGFDKVWFTHGHEGDHYFYETDPLIHYNPSDFMSESVQIEGAKKLGQFQVDLQLHELACYLRQRQQMRSDDDRYVAVTMHKAIDYLEQVDRNKQFYLWVDSFDPHEPWDPPSIYRGEPSMYDPEYTGRHDFVPFVDEVKDVYTERELHHIRMLYAELVTLCDTYFGQLLDAIRRLGFEENTLIMLVSDHGEPMGYGEHGHGLMRKSRPWPYEELVHAPMLLRAPGIKAGQRIKAFVQSVDVAPTVCDWLGIGVHPDMQGFSLLPICRGEVEKVRDFAIAGYFNKSWAIFNDDWSYIHWLANDKFDKNGNMDIGAGMRSTSEHLKAVGGKTPFSESSSAETIAKMKAEGKYDQVRIEKLSAAELQMAGSTVDGEDQWTCTPGSSNRVPEKDELYNRRTDPFQLNNIIDKEPEVARKLFDTLRAYISELRAS